MTAKDDKLTGEAAWKAHKDRVAERNAAVSKTGKEQRAGRERRQAEARRDAEVRSLEAVKGRHKP